MGKYTKFNRFVLLFLLIVALSGCATKNYIGVGLSSKVDITDPYGFKVWFDDFSNQHSETLISECTKIAPWIDGVKVWAMNTKYLPHQNPMKMSVVFSPSIPAGINYEAWFSPLSPYGVANQIDTGTIEDEWLASKVVDEVLEYSGGIKYFTSHWQAENINGVIKHTKITCNPVY